MSRPRKPRPRAETTRETRAALIAAALEEFAVHGLDASLDGICARAKVTRGAFYVHFADREALILAAMNQLLGGFVALVTAMPAVPGASERAIRMFVDAARARAPAVHAGRGLRFFHLLDACHRSPAVGDAYRELILDGRDRMTESLAADQRAGAVRATPAADALAELLVVAALGIVAALELDLPLDISRLADTMLAAIAPASRSRRAP